MSKERNNRFLEACGITPGPWVNHFGQTVTADRIGGCSMQKQMMKVCDIRGWGCLQYFGEEKAISEQEANASLIASSPDMLYAMVGFKNDMAGLGFCGDPDFADIVESHLARMTEIIESALPGKDWPEIRELWEKAGKDD